MSWLLWREYRLNRWILVTAAVAIVISYLFGWLLNSYFPDEELEDLGPNLGLAWSLLAVALLAGNAFAGERADRSAEFLAYLPLERRRTLAGKLLLHGIAVVVLVAINLPMIKQPLGFVGLGVGIGIALVLYSVNWLVSSLQSSPALATVSGFVVLMVIVMFMAASEDLSSTQRGFDWLEMMIWPALVLVCVLSIVCFSVGTRYYLRDAKE
jgi:ABC-type transport system involved in multi-copper enzyme maturation permease subunit